MIRINTITRGRFGNKILHYNSLMQLASLLGEEVSCARWEGHDIFCDLVGHSETSRVETVLTWQDVLSDNSNFLGLSRGCDYVVDQYCLHNVFWKLTKNDPRNFIQIRPQIKRNLPTDKINVGIHLRGTDILGADGNHGREIHNPGYYKRSIDLVESEFDNAKYYVCSDDLNFTSYKETIKHLEQRNCSYELGNINNYVADFFTLCDCEVLIASSSTFVVCAGFLGKENKKIIHSQEWIEKNLNHLPWHRKQDPDDVRRAQLSFDDFWVSLYNGGNEFYKVWRWV